ncbi:MAG: hypothetical protein U9Q70_04080 [Chloroflexota bacterium]|nr:hypothetical protein [Chloroflexota bacterium]
MKHRWETTYITLNENRALPVSAVEEAWVAEAVRQAWPPVTPPADFVVALEQELLQEAARRQSIRQRFRQLAGFLGILGGGIFSLVGGMLLWRSWQQKEAEGTPRGNLAGVLAPAGSS